MPRFDITGAVLGNLTDPKQGMGVVAYLLDAEDAVGRNAGEKLAEIVSAKDFGAVGDGVADDTAAIAAALIHCRGADRKLVLGKGVYRVTGTLELQDVHICGVGFALDTETTTTAVIQSSANPIATVSPYPGTVIENIKFKGIGADPPAAVELWDEAAYAHQIGLWVGRTSGMLTGATTPVDGYNVGGSGGLYLRNVAFCGINGWALYAYKLWGQSVVENLHIRDCGHATDANSGAICLASECVDLTFMNVHGQRSSTAGLAGTFLKVGASKTLTDALGRFYVGPAHIKFYNCFCEFNWDVALDCYFGVGLHFVSCQLTGGKVYFRETPQTASVNIRAILQGCGFYHAAHTTTIATGHPFGGTDTTLYLTSGSGFPSSGVVLVGSQPITYTGKSGDTLTGCSQPHTAFPEGTAVSTTQEVYIGNPGGVSQYQVSLIGCVAERPVSINYYGDNVVVAPTQVNLAMNRLVAAAGNWNYSHMEMGGYHLWVDSTGLLRIKSGPPDSDTDGTVVGAQT